MPNHPSQVWMLHPVALEVAAFANVVWVLRAKDVSVSVADGLGLSYHLISTAASGLVGNGLEFLTNVSRCIGVTRRQRVDLWVTKYGCGNIAALLSGCRSLAFNDDDADVVPLIAWSSYPFATAVIAPDVTRMGPFNRKTIKYASCHELFYLHPNRFSPDPTIRGRLGLSHDEPYALLRLVALTAHHDIGVRGISESLVRKILALCGDRVRLFISAEKHLDPRLEHLRLPVAPHDMPHVLAFADFVVGDSQSMTAEAAVLGTPAFRLNDFVGRVSYLAELERYGLAFGFTPEQGDDLLVAVRDLLHTDDRQGIFEARRRRFLSDKVDPVPLFVEVIRRASQGARLADLRKNLPGGQGNPP